MSFVRERLNPKNKRQITKDWQAQFSCLGVYRPMYLLRRVGPIVAGICLDRGSSGEEYYPKFHIHVLSVPFPGLSLTLCRQIRTRRTNAPDGVVVGRHAESYLGAVQQLREVSLFPLCEDLTRETLDRAFHIELFETPNATSPSLVMLDHVSVLAWQDRTAEALELCKTYVEIVRGYGPGYWTVPGSSFAAWEHDLLATAVDVEGARRCVIEETEKHKLTKLPYADLL